MVQESVALDLSQEWQFSAFLKNSTLDLYLNIFFN